VGITSLDFVSFSPSRGIWQASVTLVATAAEDRKNQPDAYQRFEADYATMTLGHMLSLALDGAAISGVVTSTIYSLMVAVGVFRFRRSVAASGPLFLPPVSVLKALHGDEPDLERNLTSFFEQDYPEYEILFCARHSSDAGLEAARRVAARFPNVKARFLTCGEPPWPNARTYSLEIMQREACYPILVASDSDVRVGPGYLASVVQPMSDEHVGMVTCIYRGVARRGFWARLEAMGMSVEMTSGVLVAEMFEGMQFALGPSMVIRKNSIEKIGGFAAVAQYYADDFVLGNWIARSGEKVVLSHYIVEHHVLYATFKESIAHQPLGHRPDLCHSLWAAGLGSPRRSWPPGLGACVVCIHRARPRVAVRAGCGICGEGQSCRPVSMALPPPRLHGLLLLGSKLLRYPPPALSQRPLRITCRGNTEETAAA